MHAGLLDEGSQGEAPDPRSAQAPAGALQGTPLSGRQEGQLSATSPMTKPYVTPGLLGWGPMSASPLEQQHLS